MNQLISIFDFGKIYKYPFSYYCMKKRGFGFCDVTTILDTNSYKDLRSNKGDV